MAYSPVEQRYIDMMVESYFPTTQPEPMAEEEPSLEGMQLAAGPSDTRTDAGVRLGRGGVTKAQSEAAGGLDVPLRGMLDMGAATVKGTAQSFAGLPGDFEMIGRGVAEIFNRGGNEGKVEAFLRGMQQKTILPTTENVKEWLDKNIGMVNDGENPYESIGEVAAPGGYIKGTKKVIAGAKAAGTALAPTAATMMESGLRKSGMIMDIAPGKTVGPNVISTRLPTAVKATENPLEQNLVIDFESTKKDPEAFNHNISLVQQYPNFASKARNPEKRAEDFITEVKNNLLYLYDKVPEDTRARSMLWYDGARNIVDRWGKEYNQPDQALAGVLAVLSPQKDWFMNVSLGQRVLDVMTQKQGYKWDDAMSQKAQEIWAKEKYAPMLDAIKGKTLQEIDDPGLKAMWLRTYDQANVPREHQIVTPEGDFAGVRLTDKGVPYKTGWGSLNEIGKAVVILQDPSKATISSNLGGQHKVRSFYSNIYAPYDPSGNVTIDTHAVAAGLLRPLSGNSREVLHNFGSGVKGEGGPANSSVTGVQGTYGLYAEAYRRAAQERGVLPRQMQSITWEAVRGLFPDTFKTAKNSETIDNIWLQYRKGKMSLEEARDEVFRTAGGINPPEWERAGLRAQPAQEIQPAINQGELPGAGVSGGNATGVQRGKSPKGNQPSITGGGQAPTPGAK